MLTHETLVERLLASGIVLASEIIPCSDEEVAEVQAASEGPLPEEYKSFLRVCGKGAGWFLDELAMFYPSVTKLTRLLREMLDGIVVLPPRMFVFMDHQGDTSMFYVWTDPQREPVVYAWREDWRETRRVKLTFWQFIEEEMEKFERSASRWKLGPRSVGKPA